MSIATDAAPEQKQRSPLSLVWLRFKANRAAVASGIVLIVLVSMAIFAPFLTKASYEAQNYLERGLETPSAEFWFGIDDLGRDFFSRIVYGARVSLTIGFASALFSASASFSASLSDPRSDSV